MSDIPPQEATPVDETTMTNLIDVVRKYVNERLIPLEPKISEEDKIPDEVVQEMRDLGLFGLTIPQEYGGIGLNTEQECRVVMELGRTSPAFRSISVLIMVSVLRESSWMVQTNKNRTICRN